MHLHVVLLKVAEPRSTQLVRHCLSTQPLPNAASVNRSIHPSIAKALLELSRVVRCSRGLVGAIFALVGATCHEIVVAELSVLVARVGIMLRFARTSLRQEWGSLTLVLVLRPQVLSIPKPHLTTLQRLAPCGPIQVTTFFFRQRRLQHSTLSAPRGWGGFEL